MVLRSVPYGYGVCSKGRWGFSYHFRAPAMSGLAARVDKRLHGFCDSGEAFVLAPCIRG
jgi:hypothetical protein